MNLWLHKTILQKLAENGGNIPKELLLIAATRCVVISTANPLLKRRSTEPAVPFNPNVWLALINCAKHSETHHFEWIHLSIQKRLQQQIHQTDGLPVVEKL